MRKENPPWPIEDRRYFKSLEDLKAAWAKHAAFRTTSEGGVTGAKYVIIADSPYSGVNSIDVYCYVCLGEGWRLHALIFLPHTATFKVDVKQTRDGIELFSGDSAIATINLGKSD